MKAFKRIQWMLVLAVLIGGGSAHANPIPIIPVYTSLNYQGAVYDEGGDNPVNGFFDLSVRIYDQCDGGALLHQESFAGVTVTNGIFQVVLGSENPLSQLIFDGSELWVETEFDGTVFPREVIRPVAHALTANNAAFARGLEFDYDSGWVRIDPGDTVTKYHYLDGTYSNYTVFLDGKCADGYVHRANLGTTRSERALVGYYGCEWHGLNGTRIKVTRGNHDHDTQSVDKDWHWFRVRILKNKTLFDIPQPVYCYD